MVSMVMVMMSRVAVMMSAVMVAATRTTAMKAWLPP